MGMVLDDLDGKYICISFAKEINAVRRNPNDVSNWIDLAEIVRAKAVCDNRNFRYAERWHNEAFEVCKRAITINPSSIDLIDYMEEYRNYLKEFGYVLEQ